MKSLKTLKANLWVAAILRVARIATLAAVIGFSFTACGGGDGGGGGNGGGGGGGGGNSGGFTMTGIPSKYNGRYVISAGSRSGESEGISGFQSFNASNGYLTFPRISNGSVSIPMWEGNGNNTGFTRYSGNQTYGIVISVHNTQTLNWDNIGDLSSGAEATIVFNSVTFSNGSASRSYNDADFAFP